MKLVEIYIEVQCINIICNAWALHTGITLVVQYFDFLLIHLDRIGIEKVATSSCIMYHGPWVRYNIITVIIREADLCAQ